MKYIVTINDKNYEVEVERGEAKIVGTQETATVPQQIMQPQTASPQQVILNTQPQQQQTPAQEAVSSNSNGGFDVQASDIQVKAPMPGTILSIKVTNGQKVKSGDILLMLEAMKMENEITSPEDGTVVQVIATKGSSVSTGDLLVVIRQ